MPLDLGYIVEPANTESVILPVQCPGNGAPYAGLSYTRGPNLKGKNKNKVTLSLSGLAFVKKKN